MIVAAVLYLAACLYVARLIATAPEGYEDVAGFHLGPEPFHDAAREHPDALASAPSAASFHEATNG